MIDGLYLLCLRAFPPSFREAHGREMLQAFRLRERDVRGWGARWRFRIAAMWNVLWNGFAERRRPGRREADAVLGGLLPSRGTKGGGGGMDGWIKDLRFAWRTLWRNPGFAVVAVVTIALGIGANTAIFSVVRTVLLAPLPYEEPEELVMVWGEMRNRDVLHFPTSPPDFMDLRDGTELLEEMEAVFTFQQPLTAPDADPVQIDVGFVTDGFFGMLGVAPALGRDFQPSDAVPNEAGVQPGAPGALPIMVLLSHGFWEQRYGSDPEIVGRVLQLGGAPAEVVGVLPEDFELLLPATAATTAEEVDLWSAARIDFANAPRNNVFLRPLARLRDGATVEQAQAEIDRVSAELTALSPMKESAGYAVRLEPLHEDLTSGVRPVLLALLGTVVFVLLIACANVANLLLVRASGREKELSVRAALGGSRRRLIRQMLMESGLLALLGAILGTLIAAAGIQVLPLLQPGDLPRMDDVRIDGMVLGVTAVAALAAAVLFGLAPALQSSATDLGNSLKDRGGAGVNRRRKLLQSAVVIAEVSLSVVLLIGAGLMVRSFSELSKVDPGYATDEVLTFNLSLPPARYPAAEDREAVMDRLQREFEAIPGVSRASAAFPLPLSGQAMNGRYGPEEALSDPEAFRQAAYRAIRPGYFEAMGTRLLEGRTLETVDMTDAVALAAAGMEEEQGRGRVVIDEVLARTLWPDRSPIGETFLVRVFAPEPVFVEVVGVVEHQRNGDLAEVGMPAVFFPDGLLGTIASSWAVRAGIDPLSIVPQIREVVSSVDADAPISDVRTMGSYVDEAMAPTRFALTLIGVFGLIALALSCVGLYGVLSYVVRQRTSEIGVRMAFGAERGNITRLVVRQGLGLAGAGLVLGLGAAVGLSGFLESLMVGISPTDPITFGGIGLLFAGVAAAACYLPARRAARLDPVSALREE